MELSASLILVLILSGILVGFINSISAGGTAISISLYLFLGLPPQMANATNRIGVLVQALSSSISYKAQNVLNVKQTLYLALPTMIGAFVGSMLALITGGIIFKYALAIVLLMMVFLMFYNPKYTDKESSNHTFKKMKWVHVLIYFLIGVYGGFIQVGTGFFLMTATVLGMGFDWVRSNAMKVGIMFFYSLVALIVFYEGGLIYWKYGILHASGTVIGSIIGSRLAVVKGATFIKWITAFVILITASELLGILDFKLLFSGILKK